MPLDQRDDDPLADAIAALRTVIVAGERYRQAVSDRLGISANETAAVAFLYARGQVGQTELAHELNITTSSTTTLIDRLEANDLAERVAHPVDRRRSSVRLTDTGRRTLEESRAWFRHAFDAIAPEQIPETVRALETIAANLGRQIPTIADPSAGPPR
jgi:DNA-binding MarR family transcriptional regulator